MKSLLAGLGGVVARSPIPQVSRWASPGPPVFTTDSSQETQLNQFESQSEIFTIVDRNAEIFAAVDWRLYQKGPNRARTSGEERTEVTSHPVLDLLARPNEFMTGHDLRYQWSQHMDLVGETYWVQGSHPAMKSLPLELWPISPHRMSPVPDPFDLIKGWGYRSPDGELIALDRETVIFGRRPHHTNPLRGIGPIQALMVDLDANRNAALWNAQFFYNSAEPGGIIEFPEGISDADWEEFVERWNTQHKGVVNAHRVATIERGKWVNRSFSMRDMQFTELRKSGRENVLFAFGFPKTMAGQTEDVNRATALAAKAIHADAVTVPKLGRFKRLLNELLLPKYAGGDRLEFDHDDPVPDDPEQKNNDLATGANAAATLVGIGYDPEQVLQVTGLPPIDWHGFPDQASVPAPPPARLKDGPGDADKNPG